VPNDKLIFAGRASENNSGIIATDMKSILKLLTARASGKHQWEQLQSSVDRINNNKIETEPA
jgi:hypothetical protein